MSIRIKDRGRVYRKPSDLLRKTTFSVVGVDYVSGYESLCWVDRKGRIYLERNIYDPSPEELKEWRQLPWVYVITFRGYITVEVDDKGRYLGEDFGILNALDEWKSEAGARRKDRPIKWIDKPKRLQDCKQEGIDNRWLVDHLRGVSTNTLPSSQVHQWEDVRDQDSELEDIIDEIPIRIVQSNFACPAPNCGFEWDSRDQGWQLSLEVNIPVDDGLCLAFDLLRKQGLVSIPVLFPEDISPKSTPIRFKNEPVSETRSSSESGRELLRSEPLYIFCGRDGCVSSILEP
jgi:hypothetical protein